MKNFGINWITEDKLRQGILFVNRSEKEFTSWYIRVGWAINTFCPISPTRKKKNKIKKEKINFSFFNKMKNKLCSFYFAGLQARCTNMKSFRRTVNTTFHILYVGIPNSIRSSMRMAYVVSEMSAFTTNITFSHLCTS